MSDFKKYIHLERFGTTEVEGIDNGLCYIFPKIDGTNASIWFEDGNIQAGSRKRHLSIDDDNAGFCKWVNENPLFVSFFNKYPDIRLYGEWLVPHSIKTYKDDAWRNFYVFDVQERNSDKFLNYQKYTEMLNGFNIDYIPPLALIKNPSYEKLLEKLQKNTYLIKEGSGYGEGLVIKNYEFINKYGRACWAKLISNDFKEKHSKEFGCGIEKCKKIIEEDIIDKYITGHFVNKVYDKIKLQELCWSSKLIPRLLDTVFYDLVREELWDIVKEFKNPTINFKTLKSMTTLKIKQLKPELF